MQDDDLLSLAADAAAAARAAGADFADVDIARGRSIAVSVEANDVRLAEQHEPCAFSVRAFVNGGMGSSSGDGEPTLDELRRHVQTAVDMARLAGRDPDFRDLPAPADPLTPNDALSLYDPAIEAVSLADAVRLAREGVERVLALDSGIVVSGDVAVSGGMHAIASTTGFAESSRSTFAEVSLFAVARDGDDVGSFAEYTVGRHWSDLRIEPLAGIVVAGARRYQHARPGPARPMTLLLAPLAAGALLGSVVAAASAESIRRKRSVLAGRLGQRIGSPLLTIEDRPLEARGLYSGAFDGDGSPRLPVTVVREGLFAEMLTNHYTARLAGVRNNGRGTRRATIGPSNLHIQLGAQTEAELIRQIDDGIYLQSGSLEPDLASGDFSAVLDFAMKIDKGELTYPLAGAMAAGSLDDLLLGIDAVSRDYRADPGLVLPAVRVANVQFSGAG